MAAAVDDRTAKAKAAAERRQSSQEAMRAQIRAARQAKQAEMAHNQSADPSTSAASGGEEWTSSLAGAVPRSMRKPSNLLKVPIESQSASASRRDSQDSIRSTDARHLTWYAEEDDYDYESGRSEKGLPTGTGSASAEGEDDSTIHGHEPLRTARPGDRFGHTPSPISSNDGRSPSGMSVVTGSNSSESRPGTAYSSRPRTSVSSNSSGKRPISGASSIFSPSQASSALDEMAAALQAQRAASPGPSNRKRRPQLAPLVPPPSVPLPTLPAGASNSRPSSLARSTGPNGSSTSLASMASDRHRLKSPTSPSWRAGSESGILAPKGPPPSDALPPLPLGFAPSKHVRRISGASSRSSASTGARRTPLSEGMESSPRNSISSNATRSPLGQVDDVDEVSSDDGLSEVLHMSNAAILAGAPPVPSLRAQDGALATSASLAAPSVDEEERRRQSLMRKSIGGLIAAVEAETESWKSSTLQNSTDSSDARSPSSSTTDSPAQRSSPNASRTRNGSGAAHRPPTESSPAPSSSGVASVGLFSGLRTAMPLFGRGNVAQKAASVNTAASTPPTPPAISVDEADSLSESDSSDADAPRKRRKQRRPKNASRWGFEEQRVAPPTLSSNSESSASSKQQDAAQWAYYQFSPDLPPFMPAGLKPSDMTGMGTWRGIAARAGAMANASASPSVRGSTASFGSLMSLQSQVEGEQPQSSGPVSMRELAAQARRKMEVAQQARERQASLLAQRSFMPIDIHAMASDHAMSEAASMKGSSASSIFSFDSSLLPPDADRMSVASTSTAGIASPRERVDSSVSTETRASTGTLVGLGIQAHASAQADASAQAVQQAPAKKYVDMCMQTSPTSSPDPTPPASPVFAPSQRKEMGVGEEPKESRRTVSVVGVESITPQRRAQLVWSDDENAAAGGEVRATTPTQRRPLTNIRHPSDAPARAAPRLASRSNISSHLVDLDGMWPPRLSAPRLSSRRSNVGAGASPRLSRSPSMLSVASGSFSESTIGPESDAESDESDLDLGVSLEALAERSGVLDVPTTRGAKRKHHNKVPTFSEHLIYGQRKIAPAPRSRFASSKSQGPAARPNFKSQGGSGPLLRRPSRLSQASTGWSSPESESEDGDNEETGANFIPPKSKPSTLRPVAPRARPSAPATIASRAQALLARPPITGVRRAASATTLGQPRHSFGLGPNMPALSRRGASPTLDLGGGSDDESLLHSELDDLPQLEDDDFLPTPSRASRLSAAPPSPSPSIVRAPRRMSQDALLPTLGTVSVSGKAPTLSTTDAVNDAAAGGPETALPEGRREPSDSAKAAALATESGAAQVVCTEAAPTDAAQAPTEGFTETERRSSAELEDTPNTLGSEMWSTAGDRRSVATTATTWSEGSAGSQAGPELEREAEKGEKFESVHEIKAANNAPEHAEASAAPISTGIQKDVNLSDATEAAALCDSSKSGLPPLAKARVSGLRTPARSRTLDVGTTAESLAPQSKLKLPSPRPTSASTISTKASGIRPPSSMSRLGIQTPGGRKSTSDTLKSSDGPGAASPASGLPLPASANLRRMKSFGDTQTQGLQTPPLSTLPIMSPRLSKRPSALPLSSPLSAGLEKPITQSPITAAYSPISAPVTPSTSAHSRPTTPGSKASGLPKRSGLPKPAASSLTTSSALPRATGIPKRS